MKLQKIVFLYLLISRLFDCIDRCKTKVTYKGDRPIISSNTAMLITDIALKIANFIMFQKIANVLSIVSDQCRSFNEWWSVSWIQICNI